MVNINGSFLDVNEESFSDKFLQFLDDNNFEFLGLYVEDNKALDIDGSFLDITENVFSDKFLQFLDDNNFEFLGFYVEE